MLVTVEASILLLSRSGFSVHVSGKRIGHKLR